MRPDVCNLILAELQEQRVRKEKETYTRRRLLKTVRTEEPMLDSQRTQVTLHKIKPTWKCGGVKISELVKKIYKGDAQSDAGAYQDGSAIV